MVIGREGEHSARESGSLFVFKWPERPEKLSRASPGKRPDLADRPRDHILSRIVAFVLVFSLSVHVRARVCV